MAHPFPLFEAIWSPSYEVLVTPEITSALEVGAAVAIGVSGGKDSAATALATIDYLDDVGHRGPRVLIHSDLGRVEWRQSLPACQRLAVRLGLELIVVRRETGDLVDRWRSRWKSNVRRYAELSCVKLILPWSNGFDEILHVRIEDLDHMPKIGPAVSRSDDLVGHRHPQARKSESCQSARGETTTETGQRYSAHPGAGLASDSRLDHTASVGVSRRERIPATRGLHAVWLQPGFMLFLRPEFSKRSRSSVQMRGKPSGIYIATWSAWRVASTFSFQPTRWLGDVAPHSLTGELRQAVIVAKAGARRREAAEAKIPQHLLYTEGWPKTIPTAAEASLLCDVRREVASAVGIQVGYTEPLEVIRRYEELLSSGVGTAA